MTNHPNRSRRKAVSLSLTAADVRALEYVHRHLVTIEEDFPERGEGQGYDAITVRDMHRGVALVGDLIRQFRNS